jgi:hypothetical protein
MKKDLLLLVYFCFVFQISFGQTQEPWHNHKNYHEEIISAIKKGNGTNVIQSDSGTGKSETTFSDSQNKNTANFAFVNGINIAWVNFGRDIGKESNGTEYHPNLATFGSIFDQVKNAGGNVVRWWYHTNGSTNPVFNASGYAAANPAFFGTDVLAILDLAASKGIKVQICLWSFDMLKGGQWNVNSARNKMILTSETHLQAYIDNALVPLVNAVGNHPGLFAWEIFNEPEGMTLQYALNWPEFTDRVTISNIQWMINKTTAAIKTAQPNVKVTNGAVGFRSNVDNGANGYINEYTNQKLIAAGGQAAGVLDLYNIHYYDWAGTNGSPFHNNYSSVNLDKPTVIAEYYPINTFGVNAANLGTTLVQRGWHGSLVWSWTDKPWSEISPVLTTLSNFLDLQTFESKPTVSIYPNPVKNSINIKGLEVTTYLEVFNMMGKSVITKTIDPLQNSIDLSSLSNGMYLFNFKNEYQNKAIKIIKE